MDFQVRRPVLDREDRRTWKSIVRGMTAGLILAEAPGRNENDSRLQLFPAGIGFGERLLQLGQFGRLSCDLFARLLVIGGVSHRLV